MIIMIMIIFFSIALFVAILKEKNLKSPLVLFNSVWLLLILLSMAGYEGISKPSETIYTIFLIGGIAFNVCYLFSSNIGIVSGGHKCEDGGNQYKFRFKRATVQLVILIEILLFIYYFIKAITLINKLRNGFSYNLIRSYYYSEEFMNSTLEYLAITYIMDPLIIVTELLFSISLFRKLFSKSTMGLMLAVVLLRTYISGGRMVLFEFAIIIFFCFVIFSEKQKVGFGKKILYSLLLILFAVVAVAITTERGNEGGNFFEKIYEMLVVNFTGSFIYFDELLKKEGFLQLTWGKTMIAGIIDPFITILRFIGLSNSLTSQVAVGNITSEFVRIGDYSYNAMPTMYYYFMTDFGMAGVVIGSAIFGIMAAFVYKKYKMTGNNRYTMLYLMLALMIIESPMTWLIFKSQYMMAILAIVFLFNDRMMIKE